MAEVTEPWQWCLLFAGWVKSHTGWLTYIPPIIPPNQHGFNPHHSASTTSTTVESMPFPSCLLFTPSNQKSLGCEPFATPSREFCATRRNEVWPIGCCLPISSLFVCRLKVMGCWLLSARVKGEFHFRLLHTLQLRCVCTDCDFWRSFVDFSLNTMPPGYYEWLRCASLLLLLLQQQFTGEWRLGRCCYHSPASLDRLTEQFDGLRPAVRH